MTRQHIYVSADQLAVEVAALGSPAQVMVVVGLMMMVVGLMMMVVGQMMTMGCAQVEMLMMMVMMKIMGRAELVSMMMKA